MPRPSIIPTLLREQICARALPREPEPDLVMDGDAQVAAYAEAGRIDGVMAAAYLFHSARASMVIQGCDRVVDLGCGPATQLAQIAQLNPQVSFLGVDLSEEMLDSGRAHIRGLGLDNVTFARGDIASLPDLADDCADGVISTMALHHLPTEEHLRACFAEIARILRPEGALYLVDFGRLKSLKSILAFAYMNRRHQPHIFSLDYERSLRAAFLFEDFQRLSGEVLPPDAQVYSTFGLPILTLIKSADRRPPEALGHRLKEMRAALTRRYRADLDDIRLFFKLGGLRRDPFA